MQNKQPYNFEINKQKDTIRQPLLSRTETRTVWIWENKIPWHSGIFIYHSVKKKIPKKFLIQHGIHSRGKHAYYVHTKNRAICYSVCRCKVNQNI